MKILRLEILNLASLDRKEGEVIDFEHGVLGESNIFSIVGETGSGKSTILDAICLALYGLAPRYPRRKGAKNQSIEIYGKPDDKEKNRLAPTDCRNILTHGQQTGYSKLTFRANNGFVYRAEWHVIFKRTKYADPITALYRIDSDENGQPTETTEKWETLTDIIGLDYEQFLRTVLIAQGSFAGFLTAKENDRYELLEKLIGGEDTYKNIADAISQQKADATKKYDMAAASVEAYRRDVLSDEQLAALNEQIKSLEEADKEVKSRLEKAKGELKWYEDDIKLLSDIESLTAKHTEAANTLNHMQEAISRLELHDRLNDAVEILREINALTKTLNDTREEIDKILSEQAKAKASLDSALNTKKDLEEAADKIKDEIKQTQPHINRAREIQTLMATAKEALKEKEKDLDKARISTNDAQKALTLNTQSIENRAKRKDEKDTELNALKEKAESEKKKMEQKEDEIACKLKDATAKTAGIDADILIAEKDRLTQDLNDLHSVIDTLGKIEETTICLQKAIERKELLEEENKALDLKIKSLSISVLEDEVNTLNRLYTLMTSENWNKHRSSIEEGKPCPLCGSTSHPYSATPGEFDEATSELSNLLNEKKALLSQQRQDDKAWNATVQKNSGELTALTTNIKQLSDALDAANKKWAELHSKHTHWQSDAKQLEALANDLKEKKEKAEEDVGNFNKAQKEIEKLRKQKDKASDNKKEYEEKMLADIEKANGELAEIANSLTGLRSLTANLQVQLKAQQDALAAANEAHAQAQHKLDNLSSDFSKELGGKDPEAEEQRLADAKKDADDKLSAKIREISELKERAGIIAGNLEAKQNRLNTDDRNRAEKEENLSRWLADYNNEAAEGATRETVATILNAKEDWEAIRREKTTKNDAVIKAHTLMEESRNRHAGHQESKPELPEAELKAAIEELAKNTYNRELTEALTKRNRHDDAVRQMGSKAEELKIASQTKQDWEEISAAIGADGKTMRKIAQCYTLRFLIEHANSEIRKFNQRYELQQVTNSLGIRVIDHDRGDDIRDTTSLSGGETFIVSLGLALGLASLSSKNISFSNLFIDEGFGTLDPNTLATVIDSLAMLQTSQGKKVGVISHTDVMSERIPTQIRVIKHGSSGSSHIEIQ